MGPTLARMARARRATTIARVIAVSRWSSAAAERALNDGGRRDHAARSARSRRRRASLPDAPNVIFMAGQKFGTTGAPAMTWAMNTLVPAHLRRALSRLAHRRVLDGQRVRAHAGRRRAARARPTTLGPVGEYAASCVGRERIFELYAERDGTRVAIVRLNYAIDLRYGVLVDIAHAREARRAGVASTWAT